MTRTRALSIAVMALMLLPVACGDGSVQSRIAREVSKGDGAMVDMTSVAPFKWERLHVFGPYTPVSEIHRELNVDWDGADESGIELDDGHTLLVFVDDRAVVSSVMHPRNEGDFADLHRRGGYEPSEAEFFVDRSDSGWPKLVQRDD